MGCCATQFAESNRRSNTKIFKTDFDIKRHIDALFIKYDKDHNEVLDKNEVRMMLIDMFDGHPHVITEEEVNIFMNTADKNKDGLIQKEEFV